MQASDIRATLNSVFRDVLGQPSIELRDDMTAADVPGWDSLAHVTLVYATEKRFGVKFSTREVQGLQTVGNLVDLIAGQTPD